MIEEQLTADAENSFRKESLHPHKQIQVNISNLQPSLLQPQSQPQSQTQSQLHPQAQLSNNFNPRKPTLMRFCLNHLCSILTIGVIIYKNFSNTLKFSFQTIPSLTFSQCTHYLATKYSLSNKIATILNILVLIILLIQFINIFTYITILFNLDLYQQLQKTPIIIKQEQKTTFPTSILIQIFFIIITIICIVPLLSYHIMFYIQSKHCKYIQVQSKQYIVESILIGVIFIVEFVQFVYSVIFCRQVHQIYQKYQEKYQQYQKQFLKNQKLLKDNVESIFKYILEEFNKTAKQALLDKTICKKEQPIKKQQPIQFIMKPNLKNNVKQLENTGFQKVGADQNNTKLMKDYQIIQEITKENQQKDDKDMQEQGRNNNKNDKNNKNKSKKHNQKPKPTQISIQIGLKKQKPQKQQFIRPETPPKLLQKKGPLTQRQRAQLKQQLRKQLRRKYQRHYQIYPSQKQLSRVSCSFSSYLQQDRQIDFQQRNIKQYLNPNQSQQIYNNNYPKLKPREYYQPKMYSYLNLQKINNLNRNHKINQQNEQNQQTQSKKNDSLSLNIDKKQYLYLHVHQKQKQNKNNKRNSYNYSQQDQKLSKKINQYFKQEEYIKKYDDFYKIQQQQEENKVEQQKKSKKVEQIKKQSKNNKSKFSVTINNNHNNQSQQLQKKDQQIKNDSSINSKDKKNNKKTNNEQSKRSSNKKYTRTRNIIEVIRNKCCDC